MSKELLSLIRHEMEVYKRWKQELSSIKFLFDLARTGLEMSRPPWS